MRIVLLLALGSLAACSQQPAKTVDVTAIAAKRATANIEHYAAAKARSANRVVKRRGLVNTLRNKARATAAP